MKYKCIIFDCDGVLVDSEIISAKIFRQMLSELGFEIDDKAAVEKFAGASMGENLKFVADNIPGNMPAHFEKEFRHRTYEAFEREIRPVNGIKKLLEQINVPICVASSGPVEKIRLNLSAAGLIDKFEGKIYSCYEIGSWKPDPEIYLHAAKEMGYEPNDCLVIEDSLPGIQAAAKGGFTVFALGNKREKQKFEESGAKVFSGLDEIRLLLSHE